MNGYSFIIGLLFSFAGCFTKNKTSLTRQEAHCGDSVRVKMDDSFTVKMRVPVASGYRWEYKDSNMLARLTVTNPPRIIPEDSTIDGGFGQQLFKWVAIKKGTVLLRFNYRRVFGGPTAYDDSCQVYLAVE